MIQEFATWLVSRMNVSGFAPILVIGGNFQVPYRAQDAPVRCHTLLDSGGPADFDLPYRKDAMFQLATRGEDAIQARDDAWAIYNVIHGTSGWTIGPLVSGGATYKIWAITALAKPQYLGIEEGGGFSYSTNYLVAASPL